MGCDVHMHTEIKVKGKWLHWSQPRVDRDYHLFGLLAGVRRDVDEQIAEPRGLPSDVTETTKFDSDHWNGDGHSHSWISSKEASKLVIPHLKKHTKTSYEHDGFGYLLGNGWEIEYKDGWPENLEDYRWVFWFDN